jgi:rfaE bifunctional protein nucleotidyltransferase chain/domain/rfaE bifunctional protein kinase chain/domain
VAEHVVVVGDALLDRDLDGRADRLAPDAPVPVVHDAVLHQRPGGAGLAAMLAARAGSRVTLVTALGRDPAGAELATLLDREGIAVVDVTRATTPVKTRVRVDGHPVVRVDDGDDDDPPARPDRIAEVDAGAVDAVLVSDYGRGVADASPVQEWLGAYATSAPLVWDPHPRGSAPVANARLVTPNRYEARAQGLAVDSVREVAATASELAARWRAQGVAITLAGDGAMLGVPGRLPLAIPATRVRGADPCGAGDSFAVHVTRAVADGAVLTDAVTEGVVAASAFVAAGGVDALRDRAVDRRGGDHLHAVRRHGGTLVATSGCFDLLHAGHVAMLEAARALGDALVVLLNSDRSVQDLKGAERPVVGEADRAALLRGLRCVDAVETFDELTPARALERLRPDVFVKGDDYGLGDIPETSVMERWGGTVVVVPYLEGRSTTRLIGEVDREP